MVRANDESDRPGDGGDEREADASSDWMLDPLGPGSSDGEPYDPLDPDADCFKPPAIPTEVHCLHCDREYESYLIEWRIKRSPDGERHGFWCCPTPGCGGAGFGFDILPTDPEYVGEDGEPFWSFDGEKDDQELWDADEEGKGLDLSDTSELGQLPPPDLEGGDAGDDDDVWF